MGNVTTILKNVPKTVNMEHMKPFSNIQFQGVTVSDIPGKKYKAEFIKNGNSEVIYFGDSELTDFTKHLDSRLKQCYIAKNVSECKREWCEPMNEKSLCRWILWNRPTLNGGINDYRERFSLA